MTVRTMTRLLLGVLAGVLVLTACGGGGELRAEGVRARAQVADAGPSAIYLQLTNETDQDAELVGVSVPSEVAGHTELHETVPVEEGETPEGEMPEGEMSEDEMSDDMEGMGGMRMQQVDGITVPAGETVTLEPGGLHVMLFELPEDLPDGDGFEATLEFADGSTTIVDVEVTTTP